MTTTPIDREARARLVVRAQLWSDRAYELDDGDDDSAAYVAAELRRDAADRAIARAGAPPSGPDLVAWTGWSGSALDRAVGVAAFIWRHVDAHAEELAERGIWQCPFCHGIFGVLGIASSPRPASGWCRACDPLMDP